MAIDLNSFKTFAGLPTPTANKATLTAKVNVPDDTILQSSLDVATQNIRTMLALAVADDLPDNANVQRAVFLLGKFYLDNREIQEKVLNVKIDDTFSEQKTTYYRDRIFKAVIQECLNLIAPYRNATAFMPDPPAGAR